MKRIRGVAEIRRENLGPREMDSVVDLFSIPALDAAGNPLTVRREEIDSHKTLLRGGEVLVSRLNPRKPRVHLVPEVLDRQSVASTEFIPLICKAVDRRYLRYFLLGERTRQALDSLVRSATRSHQRVEPMEVLSLGVPVEQVEVQRRIADFLDDRVARIDQIIAARRAQAQLVSLKLSVELDVIVAGATSRYGAVPLRRLCDGIEQGASPQAEDRLPAAGEAAILKTSAVSNGSFNVSECKTAPMDALDPAHEVRTGDMLVTRGSGSAALVGDAAVAVVPAGLRLFLPDLTYRIKGLRIAPKFAVMAVLSPAGRAFLAGQVRQGSGPAKARGDDILSVPVPAVSRGEEGDMVVRYDEMSAQHQHVMATIDRSATLLQEYKQSLITAAVTGEFDVTTASTRIPE